MIRFLKRLAGDVTTPAAGKVTLFVDTAGAVKTKDESGTVADVGGGGGSGTTVTPMFVIGDGAGAYTTTSTTPVDLDATDFIINMPAVAGDILRLFFQGNYVSATSGEVCRLTFSANAADLGPTNGIAQYRANAANAREGVVVEWWRTVQAGDISGGNVPVKVRFWTSGGGTGVTIENGADWVPVFSVTNYGQ